MPTRGVTMLDLRRTPTRRLRFHPDDDSPYASRLRHALRPFSLASTDMEGRMARSMHPGAVESNTLDVAAGTGDIACASGKRLGDSEAQLCRLRICPRLLEIATSAAPGR